MRDSRSSSVVATRVQTRLRSPFKRLAARMQRFVALLHNVKWPAEALISKYRCPEIPVLRESVHRPAHQKFDMIQGEPFFASSFVESSPDILPSDRYMNGATGTRPAPWI
jgi:hypothetical protein